MKTKALALALALMILCISLTSCEVIELINNIWDVVVPDDGGDTENNFWFQFIIPDPNRCTSHQIVPLDAIAPTCTTPGVSGGQVCQKCGVVVVAQTELPALDHEYDDAYDTDCNRCGHERPALCKHSNTEVIEKIDPTCKAMGRNEGVRCLDCGKNISGFELIQTTEHIYDSDFDDTCNFCGYQRKIECTHENAVKLHGKEPTCTEVGYADGLMCGHCGEILVPSQEISVLPHTEGDWRVEIIPTETEKGLRYTECVDCGARIKTVEMDVIDPDANKNASEGLVFSLNDDSNSYTLVDIGVCADVNIVVPSYYNGKPVIAIENGAFMNNTNIESVVISEGVLIIGNGAFKGCTNLKNITIPASITRIKENAFYECVGLTNVELPIGITAIEKYTFYGCTSLAQINVPYGVTTIAEYAFFGCTALEAIELPESLESIEKYAFRSSGLKSIIVPTSVRTIGDYALCTESELEVTLFKGVSKLGAYVFSKKATVSFKGTAQEWNDIIINPMNYNYKVICSDKTFIH